MTQNLTPMLSIIFIALSVNACDDTEEVTRTQPACTTNEDCKAEDLPNISISYPTCSGMTLQTPTGTGLPVCRDDGTCGIDFEIVERDCDAEYLMCGPTQEENTQGDDCIEYLAEG